MITRIYTLTVQILHDGASISGSVPLADVDAAMRSGEAVARQLGGSLEDKRRQAGPPAR
jgi:hypothetical protein